MKRFPFILGMLLQKKCQLYREFHHGLALLVSATIFQVFSGSITVNCIMVIWNPVFLCPSSSSVSSSSSCWVNWFSLQPMKENNETAVGKTGPSGSNLLGKNLIFQRCSISSLSSPIPSKTQFALFPVPSQPHYSPLFARRVFSHFAKTFSFVASVSNQRWALIRSTQCLITWTRMKVFAEL